jgi:hypothetical protein
MFLPSEVKNHFVGKRISHVFPLLKEKKHNGKMRRGASQRVLDAE